MTTELLIRTKKKKKKKRLEVYCLVSLTRIGSVFQQPHFE